MHSVYNNPAKNHKSGDSKIKCKQHAMVRAIKSENIFQKPLRIGPKNIYVFDGKYFVACPNCWWQTWDFSREYQMPLFLKLRWLKDAEFAANALGIDWEQGLNSPLKYRVRHHLLTGSITMGSKTISEIYFKDSGITSQKPKFKGLWSLLECGLLSSTSVSNWQIEGRLIDNVLTRKFTW